MRFADPEGLAHELVVSTVADAPLVAEHPDIPAELALSGFEGVRAYSAGPSARRRARARARRDATGDGTWELRGERRGSTIAYDPSPAEPAARARAACTTSRGARRSPSTRVAGAPAAAGVSRRR